MKKSQELLNGAEFKARHRRAANCFIRERVLTFGRVMLLVMQKSAKSMQLVLNELGMKLKLPWVTSSAFTQARANLKHTAFIELNERAIVAVMYGDEAYERYQGMRTLGLDGSKLYLPTTAAIIAEFGGTAKSQDSAAIQPYATMSVLYDVLNHIAVDTQLAPALSDEGKLALAHLEHTQPGDLILVDRNYSRYVFLAAVRGRECHFVARCSRASFKTARMMFAGVGADSQMVSLKPTQTHRPSASHQNLPAEMTVRFVRVMLDTGQMEILVTSLLDETLFPTPDFKPLYFRRWGSETFYDLLKTRLQLENFTGRTSEAVKQDFYATIYLTGLETLLTAEANDQLQTNSQTNQFALKVNQAVAFNAIKNHVFDLLDFEPDPDHLLERLTQLFRFKPTAIRPGRAVPRPKFSAHRSLNYYKRSKKIIF